MASKHATNTRAIGHLRKPTQTRIMTVATKRPRLVTGA